MRRLLRAAAAAAVVMVVCTQAPAQDYPIRSITLIVPYPPGGGVDVLARAIGQKLGDHLKQPVIVDNKPGGNANIGVEFVANAPADGYTVLITTNTTQAANEHLYKKLSYDPVKDFAPVTGLGKGGQVLVVKAESPYKTVADLVAKAKKDPGKLSFGSGSSSSRVAGEMFKQLTHTDILHEIGRAHV